MHETDVAILYPDIRTSVAGAYPRDQMSDPEPVLSVPGFRPTPTKSLPPTATEAVTDVAAMAAIAAERDWSRRHSMLHRAVMLSDVGHTSHVKEASATVVATRLQQLPDEQADYGGHAYNEYMDRVIHILHRR